MTVTDASSRTNAIMPYRAAGSGSAQIGSRSSTALIGDRAMLVRYMHAISHGTTIRRPL